MARDPSVPLWPDIFRPQQMAATIDRPLLKGPKPLDGREQVVAASAGGWLISYDNVPVYGAYYNAWRTLWLRIAAKGNPVYIRPDFITATTPAQLTSFSGGNAGDPFGLLLTLTESGLETFSDGTQFSQSNSDCTLSASAKQGDVVISVTNSVGNPKGVGDWIEIDGRAHLIQEINGGDWTVWPPLRANYTSGTVLEVDEPRVLAYLTPDSRGNVMNTDARQLTLMSLQFIEAGW